MGWYFLSVVCFFSSIPKWSLGSGVSEKVSLDEEKKISLEPREILTQVLTFRRCDEFYIDSLYGIMRHYSKLEEELPLDKGLRVAFFSKHFRQRSFRGDSTRLAALRAINSDLALLKEVLFKKKSALDLQEAYYSFEDIMNDLKKTDSEINASWNKDHPLYIYSNYNLLKSLISSFKKEYKENLLYDDIKIHDNCKCDDCTKMLKFYIVQLKTDVRNYLLASLHAKIKPLEALLNTSDSDRFSNTAFFKENAPCFEFLDSMPRALTRPLEPALILKPPVVVHRREAQSVPDSVPPAIENSDKQDRSGEQCSLEDDFFEVDELAFEEGQSSESEDDIYSVKKDPQSKVKKKHKPSRRKAAVRDSQRVNADRRVRAGSQKDVEAYQSIAESSQSHYELVSPSIFLPARSIEVLKHLEVKPYLRHVLISDYLKLLDDFIRFNLVCNKGRLIQSYFQCKARLGSEYSDILHLNGGEGESIRIVGTHGVATQLVFHYPHRDSKDDIPKEYLHFFIRPFKELGVQSDAITVIDDR